jgi:hypothetical protein
VFTGKRNLLGWQAQLVEFGLNPVRAWSTFAYTWDNFEHEVLGPGDPLTGSYGATMLGLLGVAILAWVFWRAAQWRLRREQISQDP